MLRLGLHLVGLSLLATVQIPCAFAESPDSLELRLVPIVQGHRASAFGDNPEQFRQTPVYKAAEVCAVNIATPDHPLVICAFKHRRLFFLFYNLAANVPRLPNETDEPYLIQRIKRTVTDYPPEGEAIRKVDYLVEAMKTKAGVMKRPDQHFGSFGLGDWEKRQIVKEFEIGLGTVEGIASGGMWPFDAQILFKGIQDYQPQPGAFAKCRFTHSRKWSVSVEFDRYGNYALKSPELGIEIVHRVPTVFASLDQSGPRAESNTLPQKPEAIDPLSKEIVLQEGQGIFEIIVGKSTLEDVKKKLGEPLGVRRASANSSNYEFAKGLTFNIDNEGTINTIFTRPEFGGKTSKGIQHGDTREKVNKTYGEPEKGSRPVTQAHEGMVFWFNREDRVTKIVVFNHRPKPPSDNKSD